MKREEIKNLLEDYGFNYEEAEIAMNSVDEIKNLFHELRNCDSTSTCEVSDRIINQILEYICK